LTSAARFGKVGPMNRGMAVLLLSALLCACGVSERERHAAWWQAFQVDRDAVYQQWESDVARRAFATDADAVRDLRVRYERVYARWTLPMDLLTQALLSYAIAVAVRVDRGEIGRQEAIRLCDKLKAEMDAERGRLAKAATDDQREAAEREWWVRFWRQHQEAYRASAQNPVRCAVLSVQADRGIVTCE
jgi:hypothetical protein